MSSFRNIVFTSVLVGLIGGVAVSAMQAVGTTPLILQAETYESAGGEAPHSHDTAPATDAQTTAQAPAHTHEHDEDAWAPADGFERAAYTVAANVLTAIGYALVLTGLLSLRGTNGGWREGLLWGVAGFAAVMLAPMIGLPPELPGSPAAALAARQTWWIATVAATGGGIALIAFRREPWAAVLALVLIVAPHVVGAPPPPEGEHALAPLPLERQFIVAATVTSFVFWALIGTLSAFFLKRFQSV